MSVYSKPTRKGLRHYYQFIRSGQAHRGGGYPTKRDALQAEAEEKRCMSAARTDITFWELGQKYLDYVLERNQSLRWYREKKNYIKRRITWHPRRIGTITRSEIESEALKRGHSSPYMANKDLKFLNAMFNFALSNEWIDKNPCKGIEKIATEKRIRQIPTIAEFNKVLLAADPVEQRLLTLVFTTLARQTEILDLKRSDDHGDYIILRTRKHKGGAIREDEVKIGPKARTALDWLKDHCPGNPEGHVFLNRRTHTRYNRRPKLMRTLCKKAGVKPFGFHDIRALGASVMAKEGVPIKYISNRLRHLKLETTEIYLHTIGDGEKKAAEVLEGAL
jgi:integrase